MPPKKAVPAKTATTLEEAVLRKLEEKLDFEALLDGLAEQIATKAASSVRLEELAEQFLQRNHADLSARLAERIFTSAAER